MARDMTNKHHETTSIWFSVMGSSRPESTVSLADSGIPLPEVNLSSGPAGNDPRPPKTIVGSCWHAPRDLGVGRRAILDISRGQTVIAVCFSG